MERPDAEELIEAILVAPAALALLARLEGTHRRDTSWHDVPKDSSPTAVGLAASSLATMPWGELLALAVNAAEFQVGPWSGQGPMTLPYLYECALQRRPIAEALVVQFGDQLRQGLDPQRQEWWGHATRMDERSEPTRFVDLTQIYSNGEFTFGGLWTTTEPPERAHPDLTIAWDFFGGPYVRWNLPVLAGARIYEIDRPADWNQLVETYPHVATTPHAGWELPGPNQYPSDTKMLRRFSRQRAVRIDPLVHRLPEWTAVSADYDGVHLSWAGFLTTEGVVSELADGALTMLRYWGSERTLWLRDVFGEPEELTCVVLDGSVRSSAVGGASPGGVTMDQARFRRILGRRSIDEE